MFSTGLTSSGVLTSTAVTVSSAFGAGSVFFASSAFLASSDFLTAGLRRLGFSSPRSILVITLGRTFSTGTFSIRVSCTTGRPSPVSLINISPLAMGSTSRSFFLTTEAVSSSEASAFLEPKSISDDFSLMSFSFWYSATSREYISSVSLVLGSSLISNPFFDKKLTIVTVETLNSDAAFPNLGIFTFSAMLPIYR